jgi:hypothetical protein
MEKIIEVSCFLGTIEIPCKDSEAKHKVRRQGSVWYSKEYYSYSLRNYQDLFDLARKGLYVKRKRHNYASILSKDYSLTMAEADFLNFAE